MRCGAVAQLPIGFRERNVKRPFAELGSLKKELQCRRRLAGAGLAFEQEQVALGKPARVHRHQGLTVVDQRERAL